MPVDNACGADVLADELMTQLTSTENFDLPVIDFNSAQFQLPTNILTGDLYKAAIKLTNDDLTTKVVNGNGTFDALMSAFKAHIREEYEADRITGADYTQAYIQLTSAAMGNAVQYLLGRDQAYWAAQTAQLDALTKMYEMEIAKTKLIALKYEALATKAVYATNKMKLATESIGFCTIKYNLDNTLPTQLDMLLEQVETQRSQTLDTRTDGVTAVAGSVGKQKQLYDQQIDSYQRDAETKVAKLFVDSWITQKTIDEGLLAPDNFTNANLDVVLARLRVNNELDT